MAFKLGLQDVSYDPELHTGEVDFDFFDSVDSPVKLAQDNNNYPTREDGTTRRNLCDGTISIAKDSLQTESLRYKKEDTSTTAEEDSEPESSGDEDLHSGPNSDEPSPRIDSGTNSEPDCHRDPGEDDDSGSHRDPGGDGVSESHRDPGPDGDAHSSGRPGSDENAASTAGHGSDSAPCSPGTERLHAVVRDVTAIQESLERLRLSARASQASAEAAPPRSSDAAAAPSRSSTATGRVRRPRPRSGWPQRKRWSSSLTEAARTRRQIAELLDAESDSSSSHTRDDSDSDGAVSADVETWLGAAGSDVGSARSSRARVGRSGPAAGHATAPPAPGGRWAAAGRLGLLAEAVRHLDRTKPRTAPPAPPRPVRAPHRKNMSFTNEEVREIDRHNRILLNKIVAQQSRRPARATPASGGGRSRGTQDQIRRENMILLQKIHTARPSRSVISGFHETPPPVRPILERGAVRHRLPWTDR